MAKTVANVLVGVASLWFKSPVGASDWVEVGYTEDGVTMEYTPSLADVQVEEESFPIQRVLTKEQLAITCNMAEASLSNMDKAMAGAVMAGNVLSLGGGMVKELAIRLIGKNPAGFNRTVDVALATAAGTVATPYKKGSKTVVPVTFQALKLAGSEVCTITDSTS